ncbi:MAG: aminotransferase class I/II-fold pyridoxal phosphate-dependent enzyme [Treponema sp.]|uniref:aminotransferase class I/II-fold pyridoxal phosphate-dependent enzyme n=1 Tax=Treponema sp. TaxID=166 RepID=UPI001B3D94CC|nr:aminotransferase class I/II-fold pyridoxal phosphate-dependent enzyme [Treponema sp.]MBP5401702.1 aminotransferase class I/II-fold pyridoxal phosphate-dependent enzyme [Treponema sp.]MBR5933611.1 aminotransferase class I/II-fold pyridoxal phosphate-dependent enzyme [Treponema sp.]
MLNPLAQELNDVLSGSIAPELFSDLGKRIFFPNGIIAQSGEAKKLGKTANGTIGMTVIQGHPVTLEVIKKQAPGLSDAELVAYAPTAGNVELREIWKEKLIKKNPSLKNKKFSLPVLVPGLTAGISYIADLFLNEEDTLIAADPSWDNYSLICETRRGATLRMFKLFNENGFNMEEFEKTINEEAEKGFIHVILNFPQNPSGYSPTVEEAEKICSILKAQAEKGTKILAISDDAYFGLNYEDNINPESLFAKTADLHKNILAVKIDGPTKEDFVWGFRSGFLTFANPQMTEEQYTALITKLMGIIRSSVSCSSTPGQSMLLKAIKDPAIDEQKLELRKVLEERYRIVRDFVNTHKCSILTALPFNSGYFMSFNVKDNKSEELRVKLLNKYGIGTVSIDSKTLRVAFSSIEKDKLVSVYETIYKAAEEL